MEGCGSECKQFDFYVFSHMTSMLNAKFGPLVEKYFILHILLCFFQAGVLQLIPPAPSALNATIVTCFRDLCVTLSVVNDPPAQKAKALLVGGCGCFSDCDDVILPNLFLGRPRDVNRVGAGVKCFKLIY